MKYLTTFIQKGDTFDIHEKCFPPPVEWMRPIASHNSHWYFSFPCQNMICIKQLLCLCPLWFTTFSYMLSMLETVFSLASYKTISLFFLLWPVCQSFMCATSIFADLLGSVGYINFLWAIAKPYWFFSRTLARFEMCVSNPNKCDSV